MRFIVGFTAGSATDITARLFAQKFQDAWNVPVTVENVPGAGGSVGGDRVAKSAPDGTTFYWGANGALTINPTLLTSQTFDVVRDLAPVARLLVMPSILAVNNDVPAKSFAEFVALAKAQPGKLSYASPGVGTPQHIAGEMLKRQAGIDIVHVPYRGAVFTDVIGGRVTMTLQNMGAILPVVRQGQLRGLAVTSLKRTPIMPGLPTMAESGLPGFEAISWFGLMAPAGTPAADRQQGLSAGRQDRAGARDEGQARTARPRRHQRCAGRVRRDHQGRHRQMGEGDQGRQHQGESSSVTAPRPSPPAASPSRRGRAVSATRSSQARIAGKPARS